MAVCAGRDALFVGGHTHKISITICTHTHKPTAIISTRRGQTLSLSFRVLSMSNNPPKNCTFISTFSTSINVTLLGIFPPVMDVSIRPRLIRSPSYRAAEKRIEEEKHTSKAGGILYLHSTLCVCVYVFSLSRMMAGYLQCLHLSFFLSLWPSIIKEKPLLRPIVCTRHGGGGGGDARPY